MKRILCYGDSNTWGHNPTTYDAATGIAARYPEGVRWPAVLQSDLGSAYYVCEEGLCGRTTVFEDPTHYGWNGNEYFEVALRTCSPVDLVIFALGTNDSKDLFSASSGIITAGMERLARSCLHLLRETDNSGAKVIISAPLKVVPDGDGCYWFDFSKASTRKLEELRSSYRTLAKNLNCEFFDFNDFGQADPSDGVHMDPQSHIRVGHALSEKVKELLK